ncbi:peptidylprolyl isomerase [Acidovorax sp. BL-A-41-H1]|uniref:peptidylprolyl isomerase n=1 Tax=Acidovorax sp. BL-A-41-H1 TaxID=3421102 RepID=UPI003F793CF3
MKQANQTFIQLAAVVALGAFSAVSVHAEQAPLVEGAGIVITADDMRADAQRMPPEMQGLVLSKPQTVSQIASNLYARRALAVRAEEQGLDKQPSVQALLKVARDKVLSDAMLEAIDKQSMPNPSALERMALNVYKTNPEKYKTSEEVGISHILIGGSDAEARSKAEALLKQIRGGEDFARLAKDNSTDAATASKGGDLGFFGRGRMVPEFEVAAFQLDRPGSVSDVIQTKFGFHIIKLNDRRLPRLRDFSEVKAEIVKELTASVLQDARAAEAQKFQANAKFNQAAIEAFSSGYKPATK